MLSFVTAAWAMTAKPVPLLLALAMAPLVGGRVQTVLVLIDLWLLNEVLASLTDSDYHFGTLLAERLIASALQLAIAYGALLCWRSWRLGSTSVSAH